MKDNALMIAYPYEINGMDMAVYAYTWVFQRSKHLPQQGVMGIAHLAHYIGVPKAQLKPSFERMKDVFGSIDREMVGVDVSALFATKKKFVSFSFDDMRTILESGERHRFRILEFYGWIMNSLDYKIESLGEKRFMSHMSLDYFAKVTGASKISIVRWEKLLEELGVLYIFRASDLETPNYIGRAAYIDCIREYAASKHKYERKGSQDKNVATLQKYNALCRGVTYSDKEILDIYNGIVSYNKAHPKKARSMEVFEKFELLLDNVS